jgi:hypothetical protein
LATLTGTETLTNKTLTSPKINEDLALTSTATELNLLTGITTLSGSNTGDQTSIVGITGTKSQFDTAVTDGNIMYDGDAVTNLNASQTDVLVGRDTAGAGALEELSPATVRTLLNVEDGATADQSDAEIETAINNQLTGTVVGTSDTQTLTNKTIDADNNTVSNLAHGAEVDNPTSGVHGATGSIVGTTDTQTLTNKTISTGSTIDSNVNVDAVLEAVYPVGSIYISVGSTSPADLFGGTWSVFGAGKCLVGIDSADTDFDTAEETGGAKTKTLSTSEMPSHYHSVNPPSTSTNTDAHTHGVYIAGSRAQTGPHESVPVGSGSTVATTSDSHSHSVDIGAFNSDSAGSGNAFSIMNPYIVVYMWKRTA